MDVKQQRKKMKIQQKREADMTTNKGNDEARKINRRYRKAAESLWENSSLRDELNDDQAQKILNWGNAYLKEVVNNTAELPDQDAANLLETQTERVTGVIRQINALAKVVKTDDRQEALTQYMLLTKKLAELRDLPNDTTKAVETMLSSTEQYSDQIVEKLLTLLELEEK